jgi:hypothetical protein
MINGKKMILVPHESVAQLQSDLPKPPAPVGSFSKMDADMEKILADKHLNEFDKYMQYESVLQRYMSKLSRQKKDVSVFLNAEEEETPPKVAQPPPPPPPLKEEKYKFEAKNMKGPMLFSVLSKTAGVDITADGDLKLKGKVLGNVDNLIDGALRNKKGKPEGWTEFTKILKNINIPLSFVNNIELKNYIKDKPQPNPPTSKITRERLRWSPYNGPNE